MQTPILKLVYFVLFMFGLNSLHAQDTIAPQNVERALRRPNAPKLKIKLKAPSKAGAKSEKGKIYKGYPVAMDSSSITLVLASDLTDTITVFADEIRLIRIYNRRPAKGALIGGAAGGAITAGLLSSIEREPESGDILIDLGNELGYVFLQLIAWSFIPGGIENGALIGLLTERHLINGKQERFQKTTQKIKRKMEKRKK
jgi:hypothetical protein